MILIDADRLRDKLKEVALDRFNLSDEYGWFLKGLLAADDEIMGFPDAIEIIRCKDCIHCVDTDKYCVCKHWCSDTRRNGFCYKGERKE